MSKARSLADLISGGAVIEASEIANSTITGAKLASDISITTTGSITTPSITGLTSLNIENINIDNNSITSLNSSLEQVSYTSASENLISRTEDFTNLNLYWSNVNATVTTNQITAPDGTTTADKWIPNNGQSTAYGFVGSNFNGFSGNVINSIPKTVTSSIFVKSFGLTAVRMDSFDSTTGNSSSVFNLSNGTVTSDNTGTAAITAFANNWFRIQQTHTFGSTTSAQVQFIRNTVTGNGTDGLYIWGSQIEEGSTTSTYVSNTSATTNKAYALSGVTRGVNGTTATTATSGTTITIGGVNTTIVNNIDATQTQIRITDGSSISASGTASIGTSNIDLNLSASGTGAIKLNSDVIVGVNKSIAFGDAAEKISGNGTDLKIESSGKIVLDADSGATVQIADNGTQLIKFFQFSNFVAVESMVSDKDFNIRGNDGGSFINAVSFDMSEAGAATFNDKIVLGANKVIEFGDAGESISGDGTDMTITGNIVKIDAASRIILDAQENRIDFADNGNEFARFVNNGGQLQIRTGSSAATAVSFDSSGGATFGDKVILGANKKIELGDAGEHIYGDGTNLQIVSSNALGFDVANGITLDSGSGGTILRAGGSTTYGTLTSSSGDFSINQTTSDKDIIFTGNDGGSTITPVVIDMSAGGKVGIGKTNPTAALEIGGSGDGNLQSFRVNASTNSEWFSVGVAGAGIVRMNAQGGVTQIGGANNLGARLNVAQLSSSAAALALAGGQANNILEVNSANSDLGGDVMVIDQNGKIGIGTTAPTQKLTIADTSVTQIHLHSALPSIRFSSDTTGGNEATRAFVGMATGNNNFVNGSVNGDFVVRGTSGGKLLFGGGGDTYGCFSNAGHFQVDLTTFNVDATNNRVGIGTVSPEVPLHVKGNIIRVESNSVSGRAIDLDADSGSVEVNDNSNWLHLQRNHNGQVAIGASSTANLYVPNNAGFGAQPGAGAKVVISNTSVSNNTLQLQTTEDSSSAGPILTLKRNSSSPADADYLGQIKFKGENDNDQEVNYAKITAKIDDASDGTEDGLLEFANIKAGSQTITARLKKDKLQLLNGVGLEVAGDATVTGNLTINGTTTTLNTATLDVEDLNIKIAKGAADAAAANGAGLTVDGASATLLYNSSGDCWSFNKPLSVSGNINLGDNDEINVGAGNDLQLYHNGSNSFIKNNTGKIYITGTNTEILNANQNEAIAKFNQDGAVELYYDNSKKFATSSTGATVTGDIIVTGGDFKSDNNNYLNFSNNNFARFIVNSSERMRIDSSGNVGIQNTTMSNFNASARQLVVGSGSGNNGITIFSGTTGNSSLFLADGTVGTNGFRGSVNYLHNGDALTLHANATETMRLSNGNVGIGTTSLPRALNIYNSSNGSIGIDGPATGNPQVAFKQGGSDKAYLTYWDASDTLALTDGVANGLHFKPSTGGVGIGTSSPVSDAKLTISSDNTESNIFFERSGSTRFDTAIANSSGNILFKGGANSSTVSGLSELMRIVADTGRVGIGTSSPNALLDVRGTAIFNEDGGDKDFRIESSNDYRMFFVDAGNSRIQIGTGASSGKLNVTGDGLSTSGNNPHIVIRNGNQVGGVGTGDKALIMGEVTAGGGVAVPYRPVAFGVENTQQTLRQGAFVIYVSDSETVDLSADERLRITNDGKVGIGTSSPSQGRLVVHEETGNNNTGSDSAHFTQNSNNINGAAYSVATAIKIGGSSKFAQIKGLHNQWATAATALAFWTNSGGTDTEKMRIISNGDIGIGTTSPSRRLHVVGPAGTAQLQSTGTTSALYFADTGSSTIDNQGIHSTGNNMVISAGGHFRLTVDNLGSLGLGTTSPFNTRPGSFTISNEAPTIYMEDTNGSGAKVGQLLYQNAELSYTTGSRNGTGTTGSTEHLRISSNGQLLVGTTVAPSSANTKLRVHVPLSSSSGDAIQLSHNTNGTDKPGAALGLVIQNGGSSTNAAQLTFKTASGGSLSERMRIGNNGNIGIGTTNTASARLYVSNDTGAVDDNGLYVYSNIGQTVPLVRILQDGAGSNQPAVHVRNDGSAGGIIVEKGTSGATANTGHNQFVADGSGNSGFSILSGTSSNGALCFGDNDNNCIGYINYAHNGNHLDFGVNNAEKMRITSAGQVGIGTSSPSRDLVIKQSSGDASIRMETASNNNDVLSLRNGSGRLDIGDLNIVILSNGKIGMGTVNPSEKLEVNGTVKATAFSGDGSALTGVGGGGEATVRAWVNFNGTGSVSVRESGNVSSVTDNGTGEFIVNFSSSLPNTNYVFAGAGRDPNTNSSIAGAVNYGRSDSIKETGRAEITTYNDATNGLLDFPEVNATFFYG